MLAMNRYGFLHKIKAWQVGSTILIVALSGCGAPRITLPPRPNVLPRTTLDIISHGTLVPNPLTTPRSTPGYSLNELVWNALVNVKPNGALTPNLARRWTTSEGNRRVVVTLDPRAKWWDGRPVTASDVVWSYRLYSNAASGFPRVSPLTRILKSVVALSPTRVAFTLKASDPGFLSEYASQGSGVFILPSFLLQKLAPAKVRSSRILSDPLDFVGTGPFRPVTKTGSRLTLKAVPRYFAGIVHIPYVVWSSRPPVHSTRWTAELWLYKPSGAHPKLQQKWHADNRAWVLLPNFRVVNHGAAEATIAGIYRGGARKALAQLGHGSSANGPILPSNWSYFPGLTSPPSLSIPSTSGLTGRTWTITVDRAHRRLAKACPSLAQETETLGVHFSCRVLPTSSYRQAVLGGHFQWVLADTRTPASGWFFPSYGAGLYSSFKTNVGAYNDAAVNAALNSAATTVNPSAHLYDLYQAQTALQKNPPGVFLVWPQYPTWTTPNLVGMSENPYMRFYEPQAWKILSGGEK